MADLPTHTISAERLRTFIRDIFAASGCTKDEGARIAEYLVGANLTGHDSHGVIRVPRYLEDVRTGRTVPGQSAKIVKEGPSFAVVDGQAGFGQTIGPLAVDIGIAKAKATGLAIVSLRNSAHIGRIGDWAERAAAAGLVSLHFVNVANSLLVAPFGGRERRMATNPVCIGIPPMDGRAMLLLDMATSVVAEGKVMVAASGGKPVPEGALIGTDGQLSADPAVLYGPMFPGKVFTARDGEGAIRAFGDHKGSGLAFMCEVLAGIFTGGGTAGPEEEGKLGVRNGMLSFYLDPATFGAGDIVERAMEYADYVKSSATAAGVAEVLVPGEPEARNRADRLANGVPLQLDCWRHLCQIAERLKVVIPN